MKLTSVLFLAASLVSSAAFAQTAPVVPPNILADRMAVRAALEKFAADRAAVPLDKVLLRSDFVALRAAVVDLMKGARPELAQDKAAVLAAVAQLKANKQNGVTDALAADKLALKAAITQLRTDARAIFGPPPGTTPRPPGG